MDVRDPIKVLISDNAPLHPPVWGGPKRIWGLFSGLSSRFSLTYVGADPGQQEPVRTTRLADNFVEQCFTMSRAYYRYWLPVHRKYFHGLGFDLFTYFEMHRVRPYAQTLCNQPADITVCSHPWAWTCMRQRPPGIVVYDAHNCEYALMQSLAGSHPFRRTICGLAKRLEEDLCRNSHAILACSEQDKEHFITLYGVDPKKVHVVENGANVNPLPSPDEQMEARRRLHLAGEKVILFVGAYYQPNIEAVRFIVNRLAPALPQCRFVVAGTVKHAFEGEIMPGNMTFTGQITDEELSLYWKASGLAVNPMVRGSGVNIKMLDYLAAGIPTVSTPFGCRGLALEDGTHVIQADLDYFAEAVKDVLENSSLGLRLRAQGHAFVARGYDWKIMSQKVETILLQVLQKP